LKHGGLSLKSEHLFIDGIVSGRDGKPRLNISTEHGMVAQLSMAEARQIAMDILVQASRAEMDAMFCDFMRTELKAPEEAQAAALIGFRDYRATLDDEEVEHDHRIPPRHEDENDSAQ
jgi:hypothetical protein